MRCGVFQPSDEPTGDASPALNRPGVRDGLNRAGLRTLYAVDDAALTELMHKVRTGAVHPDDAVAELSRLPFADLGVARIDHHLSLIHI